jgi:hypothetical protein
MELVRLSLTLCLLFYSIANAGTEVSMDSAQYLAALSAVITHGDLTDIKYSENKLSFGEMYENTMSYRDPKTGEFYAENSYFYPLKFPKYVARQNFQYGIFKDSSGVLRGVGVILYIRDENLCIRRSEVLRVFGVPQKNIFSVSPHVFSENYWYQSSSGVILNIGFAGKFECAEYIDLDQNAGDASK